MAAESRASSGRKYVSNSVREVLESSLKQNKTKQNGLLRALAVFEEGLGSIPSNHIIAYSL